MICGTSKKLGFDQQKSCFHRKMIGMQLSDFPIVCAMAERWCMVIIPKLKSISNLYNQQN
jgi:hypothetical protein